MLKTQKISDITGNTALPPSVSEAHHWVPSLKYKWVPILVDFQA
jgi:hypothetical protein